MHREMKQVDLLPGFVKSKSSGNCCISRSSDYFFCWLQGQTPAPVSVTPLALPSSVSSGARSSNSHVITFAGHLLMRVACLGENNSKPAIVQAAITWRQGAQIFTLVSKLLAA
jgi:hypothetical protein